MRDDQDAPSRRRFLRTGLLGTVLGTAGCLRFAGGGNETTEPATTERETAGTETSTNTATPVPTPTPTSTPAPTPMPTPTSEPEGADFLFTYDDVTRQLVIRYIGGGRLRAGSLDIRGSNGKSVGWPALGSTDASPSEILESGATATLGPDVRNWGRVPKPDETVRVVFVGQGSPATLGRFTVPETAPGPVTVTPIDSFAFSRAGLSFQDDEDHLATLPSVWFSPDGERTAVEINELNTFEITNTDTGAAVTVSIDDHRSVVVEDLSFQLYDKMGEFSSTLNVRATATSDDDNPNRYLSASVEGDADTFSEKTFADYKVTLLKDGATMDATDVQRLPVGHPKEFEVTVGETVEASFNAGEIPGAALQESWLRTQDDTTLRPRELQYDESTNRYVARFDGSGISEGTHRVVVRCRDPETRVWLAEFKNEFTA
jgi:hypothetical protein